ncbi:MAG: hypothetical protein ACU0DH_13360 [Paracoccus sp. (in: a-proteobacteria)]|uniref:hypothetical protein n=1 Tax=Paracoccus sp. TaxID=267 RepID=UPI00405854B5
MDSDNALAAIWIKYRLDIISKAANGSLVAPVGTFEHSRTPDGSLAICGPGITEELSIEKTIKLQRLMQYSIEHGDSILTLPGSIRREKIEAISESFALDARLIRVALAYARQIAEDK